MPFFDFIEPINTAFKIYDFISDKFKNDNKKFVKQIKRSINVACEEVIDTLSASSEFRIYTDKIVPENIYDAVILALKKNQPLTTNDILPHCDIPYSIKTCLLENVLNNLLEILQYAQYHYTSWIMMSQKEIFSTLQNLLKRFDTIENNIYKSTSKSYIKIKTIKTPAIKTKWIGRDTEIKEISSLLQNGESVIILNGLGGIGKTEVTKKYFYTKKNQYDEIFWFEYDNSLKKTIVQQSLIWPDDPYFNYSITDYYNKIINYLINKDKNTIVFVDNVENMMDEDLVDLTRLSCHVLINSRNAINGYTKYPIGLLSPSDSISLFKLYYPRKKYSKKDLRYIAAINHFAGYHTLTIELIAKTLNVSNMSIAKMFLLLYKKGFNLNDTISKTIQINWHDDINYRKLFEHLKIVFDISNLTSQENTVLFYFSLLPSEHIYETQFIRLFGDMYTHEIETLSRKGWIALDRDKIIIHNIVQETVRSFHKLTYEHCKLLIDAIANDCEDISYIHEKRIYIDWMASILKHITVSDEKYILALNNVAWISKSTYNDEMALYFSEKCIKNINRVKCDIEIEISVYNVYSMLLLEKKTKNPLKILYSGKKNV